MTKDPALVDGLSELPVTARAEAVRGLLKWVLRFASGASVDGFSDVVELPNEAATALDKIRDAAPSLRRRFGRDRRTFMGIVMNLNEQEERKAFLAFAPYSIHAELTYRDGTLLLSVDDTSTALEIVLSHHDLQEMERVLPPGCVVRTLV